MLSASKPPFGAQLNTAHRLASGLIGAWLFNEQAGVYVIDSTGRQRPGVLTSATRSSAVRGSCLKWSKTSGQKAVLRSTGPIVGGKTNWTIVAAGSFPSGDSTTNGRAFYSERGSSGNDILKLDSQTSSTGGGNCWNLTYRNDGATLLQMAGTGFVAADGVYRPVAIVKQGTSFKIAVHGIITDSATFGSASDAFTDSSVECWAGADKGDSGSLFNGFMGHLFLYDRALPIEQLAQIAAEPYEMFVVPSRTRLFQVPISTDYPESISLAVSAGLSLGSKLDAVASVALATQVDASLGGSVPYEASIALAAQMNVALIAGVGREQSIQLDAAVGASVTTATQFNASIQLNTQHDLALGFGVAEALTFGAVLGDTVSAQKDTTGAIALAVTADYQQSPMIAYTADLLLAAGLGVSAVGNIAAQNSVSFAVQVDMAALGGQIFSEAITVAAQMNMSLANKLEAVGLIALAVAAHLDALNTASLNNAISLGAVAGVAVSSKLDAVESATFGVQVDPGIAGSRGQFGAIALGATLAAAAAMAKNPSGPSEFTPSDGGTPGIFRPVTGGTPGRFRPASGGTPGIFKPTSD